MQTGEGAYWDIAGEAVLAADDLHDHVLVGAALERGESVLGSCKQSSDDERESRDSHTNMSYKSTPKAHQSAIASYPSLAALTSTSGAK